MMEGKMEFHKNAAVLAANRLQIGHLERAVLNSENHTLTHLVVTTGALFNKRDKLVPIGMVAESSPEQIVLHAEAGDLESAPAFEEAQVVAVAGREPDAAPTQPGLAAVPYGAPILGTALQQPREPYETKIQQNIPEGTVALKYGAKVVAADEKALGSLEAVLSEGPDDHVSNLLVASGLIAKELKWVPIAWVYGIAEDQVQLRHGEEFSFEELETVHDR
jgi:uncharacterized protein YrrD